MGLDRMKSVIEISTQRSNKHILPWIRRTQVLKGPDTLRNKKRTIHRRTPFLRRQSEDTPRRLGMIQLSMGSRRPKLTNKSTPTTAIRPSLTLMFHLEQQGLTRLSRRTHTHHQVAMQGGQMRM